MPHRKHEKPERVCLLCVKYVTNKLLKENKQNGGVRNQEDEQPVFVGGQQPGQRDYDREAVIETEYNRIAKRFRDAMITKAETERELGNYSFIQRGNSQLSGLDNLQLNGSVSSVRNNSQIFGSSSTNNPSNRGSPTLDSPKKKEVFKSLTKAQTKFQQETLAKPMTGIDVLSLLNPNKAPPGVKGLVIPATPSGLDSNASFGTARGGAPNPSFLGTSSPKGHSSNAKLPAGFFNTHNNTHPSFLRVREALTNAHKVTQDHGSMEDPSMLRGPPSMSRAGTVI